jgi:hypothetical protein
VGRAHQSERGRRELSAGQRWPRSQAAPAFRIEMCGSFYRDPRAITVRILSYSVLASDRLVRIPISGTGKPS